MWSLGGIERNVCPDEVRERLTEIGGVNKYDEPNFRLIWAQTDTFRAGGLWTPPNGPSFRGYRDLLIGDGNPHWILQEWHPADDYGSAAAYYARNLDLETGLQDLGEYPYQGRYETVLILISREFINGELKIIPIPLSRVVVEIMVPIIIESRKVSLLRRKMILMEREEQEKAARVKKIEEALSGSEPAFGSKERSGAYLECNSLVQKRAAAIERYWQRMAGNLTRMPKGISQHAGRPYIN